MGREKAIVHTIFLSIFLWVDGNLEDASSVWRLCCDTTIDMQIHNSSWHLPILPTKKNRSGYCEALKHFGCQLSQMRDWRSEIYVKKAQSIVIGKHATHIIIQRYQSINRAINQSFFNVKLMIIQWISKQFRSEDGTYLRIFYR